MRRFYFDIDRGDVVQDEDGELLPGLGAARRVACMVLAEMLQQQGALETGRIVVSVRDDDGVVHRTKAQACDA